MTVKELYNFLDKKIPRSLSLEWDNDGLMCCPDPNREAKKVLFALDVTAEVAEYAARNGHDAIISHHPLIFKGLKEINGENYIAKKIINIVKNNTTIMSFHTRLDALEGGVNDLLCELLGIKDPLPFGDENIGRVGEIDAECTLEQFAARVKSALNTPFVLFSDAGRKVKRVAVLGGSGGDDIGAAQASGADTFVSGQLGFHEMTDAPDSRINLIEAGHFHTENPVLDKLTDLVKEADTRIICEKISSNRIKFL